MALKQNRIFRSSLFLLTVLALLSCQRHESQPHFPDSTLVFRKYYPETEILGLAADSQWREVRISTSDTESIRHWYEKTFMRFHQLDSHSDAHCTRITWQLPGLADASPQTLQVVICDHGNYRTLLTITPQL